jgi:hypothetical protein
MLPSLSGIAHIETANVTHGSLALRLLQSAHCTRTYQEGNTKGRDDIPFLHETPDDAQSIMKTPLALFNNEMITAHGQDTDSPAPVLHPCNTHNLDARMWGLLHKFRVSKFILRKRIDIGNWLAPKTLREKLDLVPFDVLHHENVESLEEIERGIIHRITKN